MVTSEASPHPDRSFHTRLRGEHVLCHVSFLRERPQVSIEVVADSVNAGLRSVSKFAGYCPRILTLHSPDDAEAQWATVLASYFGFGLVVEAHGARREVMPSSSPSADVQDGPRKKFTERVLAEYAEA